MATSSSSPSARHRTRTAAPTCKYVLAVAQTIGEHLARPAVVVDKSTVPVGTADKVRATIAAALAARGADVAFDVVSNPEFLKEGAAVEDCMRPDRIIIGADSARAIEQLKRLYAPFNRNHDRIVAMDVRSAELTKYAANAMLATKISFMNEIANIAERVGADIEMVRHGIGSDPRIGWHFIYPGAGYGGSCFPKDVQALARTAQQHGLRREAAQAVEAVNDAQKGQLFELIQRHYDLGEDEHRAARRSPCGAWRSSPTPTTCAKPPAGACCRSCGRRARRCARTIPEARDEARRVFGERADLVLCDRRRRRSKAPTRWSWSPNGSSSAARTSRGSRRRWPTPVIFDGRNLYNPAEVEAAGLAYYGIGRGRSLAATA